MKTIAFTLFMMFISSVLFIAQCIEFLKDHTFWEMITSPLQFWTGNFAIAALIISLITNIAVAASIKKGCGC